MKRHQILPIQNHVTKRENGTTAMKPPTFTCRRLFRNFKPFAYIPMPAR